MASPVNDIPTDTNHICDHSVPQAEPEEEASETQNNGEAASSPDATEMKAIGVESDSSLMAMINEYTSGRVETLGLHGPENGESCKSISFCINLQESDKSEGATKQLILDVIGNFFLQLMNRELKKEIQLGHYSACVVKKTVDFPCSCGQEEGCRFKGVKCFSIEFNATIQ